MDRNVSINRVAACLQRNNLLSGMILRCFESSRFNIPISDAEVAKAPFYKPAEDSPEMQYLRERRKALGGCLPLRRTETTALKTPSE